MAEFEPRRAFEHIDKLAYEIGPRLAGTSGDRMAAEYIKKQFESYGLRPRVQEFKFVNRSARLKTTSLLFVTAFVALLFLPPELSFLTWIAAVITWRSLEKIMPKHTSQNIIAVRKVEKPRKRVAVTAHYDSAPCTASHKLHIFLKLTFVPFLLLISIILVLHALRFVPAWSVVWAVLAFTFLPVCTGVFIMGQDRIISPGANDNASGVAVMLEAARVLAESPPADTELRFIAFGAEEQALVGARKLVKEKFLPPDTLVVNLDMVGTGGQAYIIEGNGIFRRTKTSARVNRALSNSIQRSELKARFLWAALAKHDHIPIVRAEIQATTFSIDTPAVDRLSRRIAKLFGLPNAKVCGYRYIHTSDDTPDRLELTNIERAGSVVLDFIKTV